MPNISTQISNLENQLNVQLFYREKNGVKLTEIGEELYKIVSKSILGFEYAEKVLKEKKNLEGATIKIGCPSHITTYYLMDCIEKAKSEYKELNFKITSTANIDEMLELLKEHKIDFVITDLVPNTSSTDLVIEELRTIKNIFAFKRPLKIKKLEELEELKYILNFEYTNTTRKLMETLEKYNVKISSTIECDVTEVRVDAAKRELGIAYIMENAIKKELKNGELYEVELPIELPSISINIIYIKDQLTIANRKFIKRYLKDN